MKTSDERCPAKHERFRVSAVREVFILRFIAACKYSIVLGFFEEPGHATVEHESLLGADEQELDDAGLVTFPF